MTEWIRTIFTGHHDTAVVCFPYAGGGTHIFNAWNDARSTSQFDLYAVELPGRGRRFSEHASDNLGEVVEAVNLELGRLAKQCNLILFGHSMGGALAFQVANAASGWTNNLRGLILSAVRPPLSHKTPLAESYDDRSIIARLARYGGTPHEIFQAEGVLEMLVPMLRADFRLLDTFYELQHVPVECPIVGISGTRDTLCTPEEVAGWSVFTRAHYRSVTIDGGHFFIRDRRRELLSAIASSVRLFR